MPRRFNTAGPCDPARHYMVPVEARLPPLRGLVDEDAYFVVHAPRQIGKTTSLLTFAQELTRANPICREVIVRAMALRDRTGSGREVVVIRA